MNLLLMSLLALSGQNSARESVLVAVGAAQTGEIEGFQSALTTGGKTEFGTEEFFGKFKDAIRMQVAGHIRLEGPTVGDTVSTTTGGFRSEITTATTTLVGFTPSEGREPIIETELASLTTECKTEFRRRARPPAWVKAPGPSSSCGISKIELR